MLIVQEQRKDLSFIRLLLNHLSDGPTGALDGQFAAKLEIQVDECVKLVVNHCINNWRQSIWVFHFKVDVLILALLPDKLEHGELATAGRIVHYCLAVRVNCSQVNRETSHESLERFDVSECTDVVHQLCPLSMINYIVVNWELSG